MTETLIANVHCFCNWPDTHIHVGISACLSPFLQGKEKTRTHTHTFQFMLVWKKICIQMWNRH